MKSLLFLTLLAAAKNIGDFTTKDIHGNAVDMSRYLGFVTIMVNVASEWGLTKREYTQLQELYNKYQKDGLRIVAFPSNEFGNQEPGDNSVIEDFVTQKFGVTFDMMAKTTVNGDNPEPVIAWAKSHPNGSGFLFNTIKWNFTKFLIDRNGQVVDRYAPSTAAGSLEDDILKLLNEPQAWIINNDSCTGHMVPKSIEMLLILRVCFVFIILDCSWASNNVIITSLLRNAWGRDCYGMRANDFDYLKLDKEGFSNEIFLFWLI